jgi:predicted phosphodiesterase
MIRPVRLHVLSDLHVELGDDPASPARRSDADIVVLAGDIHLGAQGMAWARQRFGGQPIVYVAGNHEFYGQHWDDLLGELRREAARYDIDFLENQAVTIQGIRFLGATLWTDFEFFGLARRAASMRAAEGGLKDFELIEAGLPPEAQAELYEPVPRLSVTMHQGKRYVARLTAAHTLERHQASRAWLQAELPQGDPAATVVVTHHYPHAHSCAQEWLASPLTPIFGSQLPDETLRGASVWIHGHTHDCCDYRLEGNPDPAGVRRSVRVVCNPRGYPRRPGAAHPYENRTFDSSLLIEINPPPERNPS